MSDLSATSCGCGCDNGCNNGCGCGSNFFNLGGNNSCIWIILLLVFCGGCGGNGSLFGNNGCGCDNGCGNNNNCCSLIIWLIILSAFCGNNNGCGCNNGCC